MPYPEQILPNQNYKIIDSDISEYLLIRHTETKDPNELLDASGVIKAIYICSPRENIVDLSCSLLGVFEPRFTEIEIIGSDKSYFIEYCEPDELVKIPKEDVNYQLNKNRGYFTIPISKLLNLDVPYSRGGVDGITKTFNATCVPIHSPVRWNYWHYSIRWNTPEGMLHEIKMKNWIKNLCASARHFIQYFARINSGIINDLPGELYYK